MKNMQQFESAKQSVLSLVDVAIDNDQSLDDLIKDVIAMCDLHNMVKRREYLIRKATSRFGRIKDARNIALKENKNPIVCHDHQCLDTECGCDALRPARCEKCKMELSTHPMYYGFCMICDFSV